MGVVAAAAAVAALTLGFIAHVEPRQAPLGLSAMTVGSSVALGGVLWWAWPRLQSMSWIRSAVWILVIAAIFRLVALSAPISLSDDIWRYLWDGAVILEGESPYEETATERFERQGGDEALFEAINRPDNHTVYPPGAQAAFAVAMWFSEVAGGAGERWLRLLFVIMDLLGVMGLMVVLRQVGRSPWWAAVYGWHPMVYWEVGAGGHTEALGIALLAAMVWAALKGRGLIAGVAIGLAGVMKWTFLMASPIIGIYLWVRYGVWAAIKATVAAWAVVIASYGPFFSEGLIANQWESFKLYAEHFSYNAPLYYVLRWSMGYREGVTEPVTHLTGPILNGALLISLVLLAWWQSGDRQRLLAGVCLALGAYVVFSPVFHPWYAMPFVAAGAMAGWSTPAVVGALSMVSYSYYSSDVGRSWEILAMGLQVVIVGGWAGWEFGRSWVQGLLRRRGQSKATTIEGYLEKDRELDILDVGGGEGYVGAALADMGHQVQLVDIADRNRSQLAHRTYDGDRLPWEDEAFDVVVLSYVLHHARDPDQVLAESLRVGGEVVILETVYEARWDRWRTTLLDWGANMLRGMAPEPLHFDRVEGWMERIERAGGEVVQWRWLGRGIHRHVAMRCRRRGDD